MSNTWQTMPNTPTDLWIVLQRRFETHMMKGIIKAKGKLWKKKVGPSWSTNHWLNAHVQHQTGTFWRGVQLSISQAWAYHQPLHKLFYLENNSTLRVLKQKLPNKIHGFTWRLFLISNRWDTRWDSPLASSCVWTGVATALCGSVWRQRACVQNWATDSRGLRRKNIQQIKFQQWVSPRCFKPWPFWDGELSDPFTQGDPLTQVGKVTSNIDKKDHDLNHLDNVGNFPICCTKTNGVAARFFGKTFLNGSGCQCWNMWSEEM